MSEPEFKIKNRDWARKEFPRQLLEAARKYHGRSPGDDYGIYAEIAVHADVSRSAVTRWMNGSVPRVDTILQLADAYGVDPERLVGNDTAPSEGFSSSDVEARIPYERLTKVLSVMSELRRSADTQVSDDWFAEATVKVLRMVENDPGMSQDAITGAAYRLLRNGPEPE